MNPLNAHPRKRRQEEIMQQSRDERTEPLQKKKICKYTLKCNIKITLCVNNKVYCVNPVCDLVDPDEKDELGHEEAAAQVLVDGGSGVLDVTEEPEGKDAHGKTDDGDDHSQLSYPRQSVMMGD